MVGCTGERAQSSSLGMPPRSRRASSGFSSWPASRHNSALTRITTGSFGAARASASLCARSKGVIDDQAAIDDEGDTHGRPTLLPSRCLQREMEYGDVE